MSLLCCRPWAKLQAAAGDQVGDEELSDCRFGKHWNRHLGNLRKFNKQVKRPLGWDGLITICPKKAAELGGASSTLQCCSYRETWLDLH